MAVRHGEMIAGGSWANYLYGRYWGCLKNMTTCTLKPGTV